MALSASSGATVTHHANAHIEGVEHVMLTDAARLAASRRRWAGTRTSALSMRAAQPVLQAAGDVLVEAAAGDVGNALDL